MLKRCAFAGLLLTFAWDVYRSLPIEGRAWWGAYVAVFAFIAIAATIRLTMPEAWRRLRTGSDLLVPLALRMIARAVMDHAFASGFDVTFGWSQAITVFDLTWWINARTVIILALDVAYAAWTTALLLRTVTGKARQIRPWRTLLVLSLGHVAITLPVGAFKGLAGVTHGYGLVAGIAIWTLVFNLATAAVLIVVATGESSPLASLRRGLGVSRVGMGRWWLPVVLQLLLMGTFVHVDLEHTRVVRAQETTMTGGTATVTTNTTTTTTAVQDTSAVALWAGGYEDRCRWYEQSLWSKTRWPFTRLLRLFFGILAIAVKITIIERWYGRNST